MAVLTIMTGAIVERVSAIHYVPPNVTTIAPVTTTFPFPRPMDEEAMRIESSESNMQYQSLHYEDPALIALKVYFQLHFHDEISEKETIFDISEKNVNFFALFVLEWRVQFYGFWHA